MAGRHLAARLRADASLKRAAYRLTSSALDRAVETADLLQREVEAELEWVDVPRGCLPAEAEARVLRRVDLDGMPPASVADAFPIAGADAGAGVSNVGASAGEGGGQYIEALLLGEFEPVMHEDKRNLLQPCVELRPGARIRIKTAASAGAWAIGCDILLSELLGASGSFAVHNSLKEVKRLDARFDEWSCSGCREEAPPGDVHWSDDAESNGLGFCDECFRSGPKHRRLKEGDTFSRTSKGEPSSALRAPHDKNLNEADVDTSSVVHPEDSLYEEIGTLNAQILKDHAQVEAAFRTHFHRSVDHKRVRRRDRGDVLSFVFAPEGASIVDVGVVAVASGASEGTEEGKKTKECEMARQENRRWTAEEFRKLELEEAGASGCGAIGIVVPFLLDEDAADRVEGRFTLISIGGEDVSESSKAEVEAKVAVKAKELKLRMPEKQLEIFVVHQNVIRYLLLRAMQFDTTAWLNFGGSNCTMTQLRLTRKGDVICDFFGDHGSAMPVSHYTVNKHADV